MKRVTVTIGEAKVTFVPPTSQTRTSLIKHVDTMIKIFPPLTGNKRSDHELAEREMTFLAIISCVEHHIGLPFPFPALGNAPEKYKLAWEHYLNDDTGFWHTLQAAATEVGAMRILAGPL